MTRILIVEDHALMRIGLRQVLSQTPEYEVAGEAADGEQALALARSLQPDLVLMDLGLPVMSGTEVTRILKREYPAMRVLALTSHDEDESVFGALAAGADGYCLKATAGIASRLLAAVASVRDGAAWLDPDIADRVLRDLGRIPQAGADNPLSEREMEVLKLIADGLTNAEIGRRLYIASGTVRVHVSNIIAKLGVNDRVQAAVRALREGWIR
ncbi:response regulator [Gloeobacter violaceus]|uniref:Two-component response regulator n=1 Tax=Gloeobacter violaceus (strain ATCC 29082 / PCC 7421) TaxID=251221 RepID=Q7NMF3_GLOVI|nr:response regulator transcription factor [Gloeobacter violaceus]BAC88754.1 two-component response regulator [Gloeobacter violaceus PCC 7421]